MRDIRIIKSSATLIGSIVGAGILGLPFALKTVGFSAGLLLMIVVGVAATLLQLMLAEVTLRSKSDHQMPGYAGIYEGKLAKKISMTIVLLASYGTILAYLVGASQVLSTLFGGSATFWGLFFVSLMGIFIYRGIVAVMNLETTLVAIMLFIISIICLSSLPYLEFSNIFHSSFFDVAGPYGVLLFAFSGVTVIPQIRRQLMGNERLFPKVILLSNLVVFVVYALFVFVVLGVTAVSTTEVATIGLGIRIGNFMILLGNMLAIFTISTSFLSMGLSMRRMFQYDYNLHRNKAFILTLLLPVVLFLTNNIGFVAVLSLVGGILLSLDGTLVVISFWRAQKLGSRRPEWQLGPSRLVGMVMIALFILGGLATLWQQVR